MKLTSLYVILFGLSLTACGKIQQQKTDWEPSVKQRQAFTYWLRATLERLDGEAHTEYQVHDDSLAFSVRRFVDTLVSGERWPGVVGMQAVLQTLEDYGEYPSPPFRIRYTYQSLYTISPVERLLWEETVDVEDVEVSKQGSRMEYFIIRGRLSDKITRTWQRGDTVVRKTRFVWDKENKLVKEEY